MKGFPVAAALCIAAVACGGTDPGGDLTGRRTHQPSPDEATAADPTTPSSDADAGARATAAAAQSSGSDGGATAAADDAGAGTGGAGHDAGSTAPANAFTGAGAYVAATGPSTIQGDHPFAGGNPAKQNCLNSSCHGPGGGAPRFVAGGTVFTDAAGTMPAAQIEVRLLDAAGNAALVHTDANGNFFVRAGGTLGFPAHAGARDATTTRLMSATIADGACNSTSCHGGAQGWIHVP